MLSMYVLLMLVVISVILYICVIVMAKPVLINQSKPFTAEELRTLFDYHDHNMDHVSNASSIEPEARNWKFLRTQPFRSH